MPLGNLREMFQERPSKTRRTGSESWGLFRNLVFALTVAVVLNFPSIYGRATLPLEAHVLLGSFDDSAYSSLSLATRTSPFYFEQNERTALPPEPPRIADKIAGAAVRWFSLNWSQVIVVSDFFATFFGTLSALVFWRCVVGRKCGTDFVLTLGILSGTSLFIVEPHWVLSLHSSTVTPVLMSTPDSLLRFLPILRNFATQWSYALFFLALASTIHGIRSQRTSYLMLGGLLGGACIYFYFFTWVAIGFLVLWLSAVFVVEPGARKLRLFERLAPSVGFLLVSLPALYSLLIQAPSRGSYSEYSRYVLLSSDAIVFLLLGLVLRKRASNGSRRSIGNLLMAASAAEIVLPNLQPALKTYLAPFHFQQFYLHPLISGLLCGAVLVNLRSTALRTMATLTLGAFFLFVIGVGIQKEMKFLQKYWRSKPEVVELFRYISNETAPDSVFAVVGSNRRDLWSDFRRSVEYPKSRHVPSSDATALVGSTGRFVLHQNWFTAGDEVETSFREVAVAQLFVGPEKLLWSCPDPSSVELPGDIFFMTNSYYQLRRAYLCRTLAQGGPRESIKYKVDFLLVGSDGQNTLNAETEAVSELVWRSSRGRYRLYRYKPGFVLVESEAVHKAFASAVENGRF